ncbi:MAG: hypothetical protein LBR87_06570 [Synergistaceae bacterium]|jgi:hypothetical protein|nr:hypothetical protein [Synergistaceae bacterium]
MDSGLGLSAFIIIKGYIDAKDGRGNSLFGTVLALASRREIKYLSVMMSNDKVPKSLEWRDLLVMHRDREKQDGRDPLIVHHEDEIFRYLQKSTVLNNVAKNHNTKQAEQAISRFCLESLQLKAVSLMEYFDASEIDIALFEKEGGSVSAAPAGKEEEVPAQKPEEDGSVPPEDGARGKDEIVIRCEPILDPVRGVAMNELNVGEKVLAKLPEDSVFFKLLSRNIPGFDGVVAGSVTGILLNELGTATISVTLSDGISGVMKLSGKVRIKTSPKEAGRPAPRRRRDIPEGLVFGSAAAVLLLTAIAVVWYILN